MKIVTFSGETILGEGWSFQWIVATDPNNVSQYYSTESLTNESLVIQVDDAPMDITFNVERTAIKDEFSCKKTSSLTVNRSEQAVNVKFKIGPNGKVYTNNTQIQFDQIITVSKPGSIVLHIEPNTNYDQVVINGCMDAPISLTGESDYTLSFSDSSIFQSCNLFFTFSQALPTSHTVQVNVSAGGSVSHNGSTLQEGTSSLTVNHQSPVILELTPDLGQSITAQCSCGGSLTGTIFTSSPITTDNCAINISFTNVKYVLTVPTGLSGGQLSPSGTHQVSHGQTFDITVTPDANKLGQISDCFGGSKTNITTSTIFTTEPITAACSISASFITISPTSFTVTATAGSNGTISPETQTVQQNAFTTFTVIPNSSYSASVTGCGGKLVGTTYTTGPITANCSVSATFSQNTYNITIINNESSKGTVTCTESLSQIPAGSTRTLTIQPAVGFDVNAISGCSGTKSGNNYIINNISSNCTVTVTWKIAQYVVSAKVTGNAQAIVSPTLKTVNHNATTYFDLSYSGEQSITVTGCDVTNAIVIGTRYTTNPITKACELIFTFNTICGYTAATICDEIRTNNVYTNSVSGIFSPTSTETTLKLGSATTNIKYTSGSPNSLDFNLNGVRLLALQYSGTTHLIFSKSIVPHSAYSIDLGNSSYKWNTIFVKNVNCETAYITRLNGVPL